MSLQTILDDIASGLSGDSEKDIAYLKEQQEKYREHELAPQISKAIGRLMYRAMPEDKRKEFDEAVKEQQIRWDEVEGSLQKENGEGGRTPEELEKALKQLETMVSKIEELQAEGRYQDDAGTEYHWFYEFFEMILYELVSGTKKAQRRPDDIPAAAVYAEYGMLLMGLERTAEAQEAFRKAVRWDPANCQIAFEYAETFKILGDMETFFKLTVDEFKYAFRRTDLARCYRNLGYYFVEKEMWDEACACYLLSLQYDSETKNAQAELYYIEKRSGGGLKKPTPEDMRAMGKKYSFPLGPDETVVRTAVSYGMEAYQGGRYDLARYFFKIVFDLTGDERIGKLLVSAVNAIKKQEK